MQSIVQSRPVLQAIVLLVACLGAAAARAEPPEAEPIATLAGPSGGCVAFSQDGARILTAGQSKVQIWDAKTYKPLGKPLRHIARLLRADFSPDGKRVLTVGGNEARLWDVDQSQLLFKFGHEGGASSASFSPDGSRVLTSGKDATARVWEVATGREIFKLEHPVNDVMYAAFSPDGQWIATATRSSVEIDDGFLRLVGTATLWDAQKGAALWSRRLECFTAREHDVTPLRPVAFSSDGRLIAMFKDIGDNGATVSIFDVSRKQWQSLKVSNFSGQLTFSPSGGRIMTSYGETASIYSLASEVEPPTEKEIVVDHHGFNLFDAHFSTDGKRVLTAGADGASGVWSADTGKNITTFWPKERYAPNADNEIPVIAFSPDGKLAAVGYRVDEYTGIWKVGD